MDTSRPDPSNNARLIQPSWSESQAFRSQRPCLAFTAGCWAIFTNQTELAEIVGMVVGKIFAVSDSTGAEAKCHTLIVLAHNAGSDTGTLCWWLRRDCAGTLGRDPRGILCWRLRRISAGAYTRSARGIPARVCRRTGRGFAGWRHDGRREVDNETTVTNSGCNSFDIRWSWSCRQVLVAFCFVIRNRCINKAIGWCCRCWWVCPFSLKGSYSRKSNWHHCRRERWTSGGGPSRKGTWSPAWGTRNIGVRRC